MKVLFCLLKSYGDIIRIFRIVEEIKKQYKDSFIGITVLKGMERAAELSKDFDVIITQEKLELGNEVRLLDATLLEDSINLANSYDFDYYIDLSGEFQSALFGVLTNIKNRVGPNNPSGRDGAYLFYNKKVQVKWKEINRMERHLILIREVFKDLNIKKEIKINKEGAVLIAPGTSELGLYKRLPKEKYVELIKTIINYSSYKLFIIGYKNQSDLVYEIKDLIVNDNCKVLLFNDFFEAMEIIKKAKIFIGTDSAYNHIAVVNNIPTITILGPTSAVENGCWNKTLGKIITLNLPCSPCNLWLGNCKENFCMKNIKVEEIFLAFKELLVEINC